MDPTPHAIVPATEDDTGTSEAGFRIRHSAEVRASNSVHADSEKAPIPRELKDNSASSSSVIDPSQSSLVALTKVARLQTYLPTGTWVAFTALQTLAFSLSPSVEPSDGRNCNASQRIALIVFVSISAVFSFLQPFVKTFVVDAKGERIVYPPPSGIEVADTVYDNVTGATFPYKDRPSGRFVWPVAGPDGRWVRQGSYVKVFVLEKRCSVLVQSQPWPARIYAFLNPQFSSVVLAPRADDDDPKLINPPPAPGKGTIEGELHPRLPEIFPHWSNVINGPKGEYLDFSPQVWLHAFVSLSAFLALALLSSQGAKCLYPGMADWVPVVAQILTLGAISVVAAFLVDDRAARPAISPDVSTADPEAAVSKDEDTSIPPILSPVVSDVLWVYARKVTTAV